MSLPRNYQVLEFMRGVELPLPPLQRRPLMAITEMLIAAWNGLKEEHAEVLFHEEEKEVNTLMDSRLNSLFEQNPQWSMLITGISRGRESINYDGSKLEKRPDLSIHLTSRFSRLSLIVECKLLDSKSKKSIDLYCDQGLARFIDGQYAWYAREAFMLAYVRDGATIATCLTPQLEKCQKKSPDPFQTEQLPKTVNTPFYELAQSRHGRQFPNNPGSIDIWHLWLT
ncbi:MAG TPA: hypothetical protein DEB35_06465 [Desulfuromonas sp.]|nr:hypothetical protein [Desulfuromonas sp.]